MAVSMRRLDSRAAAPARAAEAPTLASLGALLGGGLATILAADGLVVQVYQGAFQDPQAFGGFLAVAVVLGVALRWFHAGWLRASMGEEAGRRAWAEGRTNVQEPATNLLPTPLVLPIWALMGRRDDRPHGPTIADALVVMAVPFAALLMPLAAWGLGAW